MDGNKKNYTASAFNRAALKQELALEGQVWDVIVIGGGATGLGVGVDAASRGFRTLLLEQSDFAKGTSSRSTKLVHGGVRYLAQGDVSLVFEALRERGLLIQNAPHLVHRQPFVIPSYSWWNKMFYGIGLNVYDWMAGRYRLEKTSFLSKAAVTRLLPNVRKEGLAGGIMYYDGQFDDARLAVNLAQTCVEQGGVALNYMKVDGLLKDGSGKVAGVQVHDVESGEAYELKAKVVVNATGVFVNEVLQMDAPKQQPLVRPSQGVHVVIDRSFLKGDNALMLPKTPDGRVLFAVPWHGHVLLGTTDTPLDEHSLEPRALEQEIDFILQTAGQYLEQKPTRQDVLSVFAGLRPLAAPTKNSGSTKEISRSHKLIVAASGLITITGGKWTTYRKMAEDTVDKAIALAGLPFRPCNTEGLQIHGAINEKSNILKPLSIYGADARGVEELVQQQPGLGRPLHKKFSHIQAEVVWAARHEMARTVEDVLARRLRVLFLDAKAAIDMAPQVAELMATELGHDAAWQQDQVRVFTQLAGQYLLEPYSKATPAAVDQI
ncbi:glycerol-3-phosphate dehydrogenase/oxidase [Pontibacter actiniarum]|uniref:glycerol-3-phosphate dehydrogenase/oxidase n=1 Tax=Pontibacter actiniarum TaxID=323450 RepID=UPI0003FF11A8|nr:glycerol-3-phosphate dehydrogenase/oxidase [Pontibacter actiniarum]